MVNQDILTALKNAVDHGDSLDSAKQIMVNSGYNPQEIDEASRFIGGGAIVNQQQKPNEELTMPNQKPSLVSKFKLGKRNQSQISKVQQTPQMPAQNMPQKSFQPAQQITSQGFGSPMKPISTQKQLKKIGPRKSKHGKEIALLMVLLILIGLLVTTILLKDTILGWFS
jgi:hypothetical protein